MEIKRDKRQMIECCEHCGGEIIRREALQNTDNPQEKIFTAWKECSKCKVNYGTDIRR